MKHYYYLFIIFIGSFILLRIPDINLPFFWDETGVYVKAIAYMYQHKISLLPQSMPSDLSRGHPLLFVFTYSLIVKILGYHIWLLHAISLCVSVATLTIVFLLGKKVSSPIVGLSSSMLLAVQPFFVAQSMMVLPEMLLAFLTMLTIYFFIEKKRLFYLIACSLALLTKESALVLPVTLFVGDIAFCVLSKPTIKTNFLKKFTCRTWILIPLIVFVLFIFIQRYQMGWFFFPEHIGYISTNPTTILVRGFYAIFFLFGCQKRFLWLIPICCLLYQLLLNTLIKRKATQQEYFFIILSSFFIGAILFTAINFMMNRYLLYTLPIVAIMTAFGLRKLINDDRLMIGTVILLMIVSISFPKSNKFVYDVSLDYKDVVLVQQQATGYLENHNLYHVKIFTNYPVYHGLMDTCLGYLHSQKTFDNITTESDSISKKNNIQWVVIYEPSTFDFKKLPCQLYPVTNYKSSYAQICIYKIFK